MSKNLFYRNEMVDYLKAHALDLIIKELNSFAEDTGESANIAFRNRVAGIIDMIDHMDTVTKENDDE
jgi:hypothetical protein